MYRGRAPAAVRPGRGAERPRQDAADGLDELGARAPLPCVLDDVVGGVSTGARFEPYHLV